MREQEQPTRSNGVAEGLMRFPKKEGTMPTLLAHRDTLLAGFVTDYSTNRVLGKAPAAGVLTDIVSILNFPLTSLDAATVRRASALAGGIAYAEGVDAEIPLTEQALAVQTKIKLLQTITSPTYGLPLIAFLSEEPSFLQAISTITREARLLRTVHPEQALADSFTPDYQAKTIEDAVLTFVDKVTFADTAYHQSGYRPHIVDFMTTDPNLKQLVIERIASPETYPEQSRKIVYILESLANNTEYFPEHVPGGIQNTKEKLISFLKNEPQVVTDLTAFLQAHTGFSKPLRILLDEVVNTPPAEIQRQVLLEKLTDVAIPEFDGSNTLLNIAIEELHQPNTDTEAALRIARIYLLEVPYKEDSFAIQILAVLLHEAVVNRPDLFGKIHAALQLYLLQDAHTKRQQSDAGLTDVEALYPLLHQGDMLHTQPEMATVAAKIANGAPIVYEMFGALGDTLLTTLAVRDMAETIEKNGTNNPFTYIVLNKLIPLTRAMLAKHSSVTIVGTDEYRFKIPKLLALLSTRDADGNTTPPGIFLSFRLSRAQMGSTIPDTVTAIETETPPVTLHGGTFRQSLQTYLSEALQTVLFDPHNRDTLADVRAGITTWLTTYEIEHTELQQELATIAQTPGFENGYICLVSQGSSKQKQLTPDVTEQIFKEIGTYCKDNRIGIVWITSDANNLDKELFDQYHMPYVPVITKPDIAYTLSWLMHARGTIGPDTFLIHAAELFTMPVCNLYVDSSPTVFRVNNAVVPVTHPLATMPEKAGINLFGFQADYFMKEFFHPLTTSMLADTTTTLHPLIEQIQQTFLASLQTGLSTFIAQLAPTTDTNQY